VPDGEQPPPELNSVFDPIKFRATLDPETGEITCDNAGINFHGDIRAEFHPDEKEQDDTDDSGEYLNPGQQNSPS
jgi:hypothetical protein